MDAKLRNELEKLTRSNRTPFILNDVTERQLEIDEGRGNYYKFEIDLSDAHTDHELSFFGDHITVEDCPSGATVKLNHIKNSEVDLQQIEEIQAPFKKLYINNSAGNGTLKLLVGSKGMFYAKKNTSKYPQDFKLDVIDLSDDTTVAHAPTSITNTLTPPVGKIYRIVGISYEAPAPVGDTAGTHQLEAYYMGEISGAQYRPILVKGNHSTILYIGQNDAFTGDSSEQPSQIAQQQPLIHNGYLWANNTYPISFIYTNSTDADQTGSRALKILVNIYNEAL